MEAVLRLLRGEPLETLSRELGVEAHRLAAWRDEFLEGGKEALKGQRPDRSGDDRALKQAERKVGVRLPRNAPGYSPAAAVPTKGWATITALLQTAAGRPVTIEP